MTILASATVPNLNTSCARLGSANCRSVASRMYCARPGLILKKQLSSFVIPTLRPSLQALAGVPASVDMVIFSLFCPPDDSAHRRVTGRHGHRPVEGDSSEGRTECTRPTGGAPGSEAMTRQPIPGDHSEVSAPGTPEPMRPDPSEEKVTLER